MVGLTLKGQEGVDVELDRRMYRLWADWMIAFCALPLYLVLVRFGKGETTIASL